jgi:hypothetical protein
MKTGIEIARFAELPHSPLPIDFSRYSNFTFASQLPVVVTPVSSPASCFHLTLDQSPRSQLFLSVCLEYQIS